MHVTEDSLHVIKDVPHDADRVLCIVEDVTANTKDVLHVVGDVMDDAKDVPDHVEDITDEAEDVLYVTEDVRNDVPEMPNLLKTLKNNEIDLNSIKMAIADRMEHVEDEPRRTWVAWEAAKGIWQRFILTIDRTHVSR